MEKLFVIKIGGNVIDKAADLSDFLKKFASVRHKKILVHGGGKIATDMSKSLGLEVKMVEGRRITDEDTLKIITMVYGGLVNKKVVASLQSYQCNGIGLTGADANIISSIKRPAKNGVDFGFVGDIEKVDTEKFSGLLNLGLTPVVAPLTHDTDGNLLNTNADKMASSIAVALSRFFEVHLIYCFEKRGVLLNVEDEDSLIETIDFPRYQFLKESKVIADGMIPKLDNSFAAMKNGVQHLSIGHASHLEKMINGEAKFSTQLII